MGSRLDDFPKHASEDSVTVIPGTVTAASSDTLSVLVLSASFIAAYALPDSGEVTIGRSHSAEVYVDDRLVSRRHAILSAGPRLTIRDLGSSNGTRMHGQLLTAGVARELAVGDVVMIGAAALLVQRNMPVVYPRRFLSHEHFEARIKEECGRATRLGGRFAVAVLEIDRSVPDVGVRRILAAALRTNDDVGAWGPLEYALLIVDADQDESREMLGGIAAELTKHEVVASWHMAHWPDDGRTAEALLAKVQSVSKDHGPALAIAGGRVIVDTVTQELYRVAERIAAGDISVLIVGETGVGKEVMAEEIHRRSRRSSKPFLRLNCGALSESLLDSELFGHERGAFTSAVGVKPGLLESADGGVVLLDEIGEMPMSLQVKLLRVLEEKEVRRVGAIKSRPLDVRFIAATNRNLKKHSARGLFREDLYYRLAGATLEIPPLRDRPDDIEPLARTFLLHASKHLGVPATMSPQATAQLRAYRWPGNIRELRHVIERAVLLAGNGPITTAHLPVEKGEVPHPEETAAATTTIPVTPGDDNDRDHIVEVLSTCGGNQSRAAKHLGISRGALIRRLERYGIIRPRKPS
jgi:two-component system response regulator AtoC